MSILWIDTASDVMVAAIERGHGEPWELVETPADTNHTQRLLAAIQGNPLDGVEAILVVIGPGAYAGIRVGIATAQGLGLAWHVPVYGIGTLEAVALAVDDDDLTVIHPAGRGEFAAQQFIEGVGQGHPYVATPDSLKGMRIAGEGAGKLGGQEVSPRQRAETAFHRRADMIRAGNLEAGAEAFYLREPNITLSRRAQAAS